MHKQLSTLFEEDRTESLNATLESDWHVINTNRSNRRKLVTGILKQPRLTGEDYYHAAMIFQHSEHLSHIKKAVALAYRAIQHGSENAKWLYAAAQDRALMYEGRAQKFGTQMVRNKKTGKLTLYKYSKRTSDAERAQYNVPPLEVTRERMRKMNEGKQWW